MPQWLIGGGTVRVWAATQWGPTLGSHDPDPPVPLSATGQLTIELYQGSTLIATRTVDSFYYLGSPRITRSALALTTPERDSITNWSDLRFRFTANGLRIGVSQAYLSAPPASSVVDFGFTKYPTQIPRPVMATANQQAWAGLFTAAFPVADYAWRGVAPDQIDRAMLPVGAIPTGIIDPFPLPGVTTVFNAPEAPPQALKRAQPSAPVWVPTSEEGLWVGPGYPNRIDPARRPFLGQTLAYPYVSTPATLAWGWYPDAIDRLTYRTAHQQAWAYPIVSVPAMKAWGWYPDTIDRRTMRPEAQQAFAYPVVSTPRLTAYGWYPSQIDRLTMRAGAQQAFAYPYVSTPATLAWSFYPDAIDRLTMRTALQQAWAYPIVSTPATLAWAFYPDLLNRLTFSATLQQALALDPFPRPAVAVVANPYGQFPDLLRPALAAPPSALAWTPTSETGLWVGPTYPHRVDRVSSLAGLSQSWAYPVVSTPATLAWGWYPDRIDARPVPVGLQQMFAYPTVSTTRISAWGYYPDRIDGRPVAGGLKQTFGYPIVSTPTLFAWGDYPALINQASLPVAAMPSLALEPFPRAGAVQLVAWGDYPAQIARITMLTALQSSLIRNPVWPIPPNPVAQIFDTYVEVGTDGSFWVRGEPHIGGTCW